MKEWVPGGELFHRLDIVGSFSENVAMFYTANVIVAFEYLHSKGIIYRDLKPENLLITTQGYLKLADFGFAKKVDDNETKTICGTPDYQVSKFLLYFNIYK